MNNTENDVQRTLKMIFRNRKSTTGPRLLTKKTKPLAIQQTMDQKRETIFANRAQNSARGHNEDSDTLSSTDLLIDGEIKVLSTIDLDAEVFCCKYTEKYDCIAVGLSSGQVYLYESGTGDYVTELSDSETIDNTSVSAIKHQPVSRAYPIKNCITCSYLNGLVKCWNYNFGKCLYTIRENRKIYGLIYHPYQPKFLTYGNDSIMYLYDEERRTQERILKIHNSETKIHTCCFNPRSNCEFITSDKDSQIRFWDLRQPHYTRSIPNVYIYGNGLDINKKGTEILACANQTKEALQIFDYATGGLISTIDEEHISSKLFTAKYANNDYAVIGGAHPNTFQVIDLKELIPIASITNLQTAVHCLDLGRPKSWKKTTRKSEFSSIPTVVFNSDTKLYEVDFC